jgi:hypothetical protein
LLARVAEESTGAAVRFAPLERGVTDVMELFDHAAPKQDALRDFRWAYALLTELAKAELTEANRRVGDSGEWPAQQQWHELVGSSHAVFLRRARERAGIDHAGFLHLVREVPGYMEVSEEEYEAAIVRSARAAESEGL